MSRPRTSRRSSCRSASSWARGTTSRRPERGKRCSRRRYNSRDFQKERTPMSSLRFLVMAALAAIALPAHAAGDAAAGSKKNFQCEGCHGIVDWKTAFPELYHVPKLGGQKAAYIVSALKAYKAGQRDHPTMRAIAADLS